MTQNTASNIGVILGHYQVPDLNKGQIEQIEKHTTQHTQLSIFLNVTPIMTSKNNPLDFDSRKEMLQSHFPNVTVHPIKVARTNKAWSQALDQQIEKLYPQQNVTLYDNGEGLGKHYKGKHKIEQSPSPLLANHIEYEFIPTADFRAGEIFALNNQYDKVFTTIDVAVTHKKKLLLARKPNEKLFRFIGGFSDPTDNNFETTARREVEEEANIKIKKVQYLASKKIDDWRYRNEQDKIITVFFAAQYKSGEIKAQDDIAELKWFSFSKLNKKIFVKEHRPLFKIFKQKVF